MDVKTKVYISSTYSDLKAHRVAVYRNLRSMNYDVISMEDYPASYKPPVEKCLEDIDDCDIYIGLIAWRYGFIPENCKKSITELEYLKAVNKGIPTIIFLLDEVIAWPPTYIDAYNKEGEDGHLIAEFRKRLMRENVVNFFSDKKHLVNQVIKAIHVLDPPVGTNKRTGCFREDGNIRTILKDDLHELLNYYHSGIHLSIEIIAEWASKGELEKIENSLPELQSRSLTILDAIKKLHIEVYSDIYPIEDISIALQQLADAWISRYRHAIYYDHPFSIQLECDRNIPIPANLKNIYLKIASSAISNSIKHSGILENPDIVIRISVESMPNELSMVVSDNGCGSNEIVAGFSILRMRQLINVLNRVEKIETELDIQSKIGEGTTIQVTSKL